MPNSGEPMSAAPEQRVDLLGRHQRDQPLRAPAAPGPARTTARCRRPRGWPRPQAEAPADLLAQRHAPGAVDRACRRPSGSWRGGRPSRRRTTPRRCPDRRARRCSTSPALTSQARIGRRRARVEPALARPPTRRSPARRGGRRRRGAGGPRPARDPTSARDARPSRTGWWATCPGRPRPARGRPGPWRSPGVGAEQEDVAGQALGDELLVERADLQIGLGDEDVEEAGVGDGAARR